MTCDRYRSFGKDRCMYCGHTLSEHLCSGRDMRILSHPGWQKRDPLLNVKLIIKN